MSKEQVLLVASDLRSYAEHFSQSDWQYTRQHDIRHIRLQGDYKGYAHPLRRLLRTADHLTPPAWKQKLGLKTSQLDEWLSPWGDRGRDRWSSLLTTLKASMRTDSHLPDGVLDGGNVITFWEETGEYLQLVQPSVGSLVADFLETDPTHPRAQAIAAELQRLQKDYSQRLQQEGHRTPREERQVRYLPLPQVQHCVVTFLPGDPNDLVWEKQNDSWYVYLPMGYHGFLTETLEDLEAQVQRELNEQEESDEQS